MMPWRFFCDFSASMTAKMPDCRLLHDAIEDRSSHNDEAKWIWRKLVRGLRVEDITDTEAKLIAD